LQIGKPHYQSHTLMALSFTPCQMCCCIEYPGQAVTEPGFSDCRQLP